MLPWLKVVHTLNIVCCMQLVVLLGISTCNIFAFSVNWFQNTKRMYVSCLPLNSLVISHERRDSSFSFIINTKQGHGTWTKRWTQWKWSLAFGIRVLSSWSWGLHGTRYSIQVLVAVSKHGWAEVPPRASNVFQSHHHRRVCSVLPLSSARWDPSRMM